MASAELQRLWKLAQTDQAIETIKKRAASLDVGAKIAAEIKTLEAEEAEVGGLARKLQAELTDLELKQKGFQAKQKKIEKDLYGGKVVNPREVENFEKEIAALKRQTEAIDPRLLELWEEIPPAEKAAAAVVAKITAKKQELSERRSLALAEKESLEKAYKELALTRPQLAEAVRNPTLLARYESIRQRHQGIGMCEVSRKGMCGGCGTHLPERTLQLLKDDKIAACEACHRMLYHTEGLI